MHARRLLEFACEIGDTPLPTALAAQAKRCLLDALGCGLFGASQAWSGMVRAELEAECARGVCTILGAAQPSSAAAAALANGTAIHGFELDDLIPSAIVHPGTVIVPAVLAAAEAGQASGARLLAAIVAGYEAVARISVALGSEPSQRGFHKTAVAGPVAAAIAAGVVMSASAAQMESAVGLACSMASGIKAFAGGGGGGMVKRLHAGRAAEAGVRAAQLARRGFTGPANALDGALGLLEVFSGASGRGEQLSHALGTRWYIDETWVKVYPLCGWIQGVAQLLLGLRGERPLEPEHVRRIIVGTSAFAVRHNANPAPQDEMEAQYSIPYCAALAASADPCDPAAFALEAIGNPALHALAQRVSLEVDPESEAAYPGRFGTRIELELADGELRHAVTLDPKGTAADPLSDAEIEGKFRRLAALAPRPVDAAAVAECVQGLETLERVHELSCALRPAA